MRRAAVLCALLLFAPTRGDTPSPWSADDVLFSETASGFQVSPDGRWAVWVKGTMDRERGERVSHLVRIDLAGGRETVLTRGAESCERPRWSPDGKRLAFLSARAAGVPQVWLLDPTGGEPWPLTDLPRGVLHYDWAGPDAVVVAAPDEPTLHDTRRKDDKDDSVVVEDEAHEPPVRLFRVDAASKKVTRLTENTDRIEQLAVSPDGRRAVAVHNRSVRYAYDNKIKPVLFLHDLATGEHISVFAEAKYNISHVRWAPDNRGFYAVNDHNSRPQFAQAGIPELHYFDLARSRPERVDLGWERGLATQGENEDAPGFAPTRDGFVALLADGVRNRAARYTRTTDGWRRAWLEGAHAGHVFGLEVSTDGKTLLYARSTASTPTQWYAARLEGERIEGPTPVAAINEHFRKRPRARTEVVRWKGADDEEVEGILYYPHDHRPGERRPLVVMIHGGPALADQDCWYETWMYPANLLCARGAFVLRPNYHGSSNYGLKWLESITRGRYGEPELIDIERGVDELIRRGLVDGERLGLVGWSNGAILANLLTARTTRYKAASAGAGSIEYVSDWASCEFGDAFDRYYFGSSPLEDPAWYHKRSPFWRLDRVRTPTLIFFGTEDRTVGVQQGWLHYRALQQLGKAPVRFVQFPGEGHVLKKLAHQRRKMEEELAWLDKHLFLSTKKENEAFKPDSPLGWALARRQARREGGRYGVLVKGTLIPETVAFGPLHVGRFEVTRAQFAAFDKTYPVEAGRENYPASGLTYEQAQGYCVWLSKTTGQTYHLPREDEADELYDRSDPWENTLDYWVGYSANPDDTARLREKVRELPGTAPLLKEAGSFRGVGKEEMVFDLGGSVAEWVASKDGKGLLRGGSADAPVDPKRRASTAAPEYRGFRVVREPKEP